MNNLQFIKGYKENDVLRNSLNELARDIFGINFEDWYDKGYWNEKYEPYSYVDGDRIVANVSVNTLDLVINNETKRAIQIGTVMTHPDYRNKGLSAKLMNRVLADYEGSYDIMYLFANHTVLDFYPKFGFHAVDEYQFTMDFTESSNDFRFIRKLDGRNNEDLRFIYEFAALRVPVSRLFGTIHTTDLLMFYCLYIFSQDIYYLEQDDVIVIYKNEGEQLHLFDVISKAEFDLHSIVQKIATKETREVVFHFTPDNQRGVRKEVFRGSEVLFVKMTEGMEFPKFFKHPLTSQA